MKKNLLLAIVFLVLVSCSSKETTPDAPANPDGALPAPSTTESTPTPPAATEPTAATPGAPADALSTPVSDAKPTDSSAFDNLLADGEKPKADLAANEAKPAAQTASSGGASSSSGSDPLFAPGEGGQAKDATVASSSEPAPMDSSAATATAQPDKPLPATQDTNSQPAAALYGDKDKSTGPYNAGAYHEAKRVTPPKKMTYEEFRDRENAREASQRDIDDVSLYSHEAGKFQFALDYTYKPFDDFNFDSGSGVQKATTQGGGISLTYFPLHELSIGRLGFGLHGAAYWSKFDRNTISTSSMSINATGKRHSIDVGGAHAVYEFDYFMGQLLVPFVTGGYDRIFVAKQDHSGGTAPLNRSINSSTYGGGLHLNLNRLEPTTAAKGLVNVGVKKFYLTYSYLVRNIASGTSINNVLGLRFEY